MMTSINEKDKKLVVILQLLLELKIEANFFFKIEKKRCIKVHIVFFFTI